MKFGGFLFVAANLILVSFTESSAQSQNNDHFKDANGNTYHQLFLDFQATEIIEMNYAIDETPVEGELSSDGFSVVIKNYPGDKTVKLKVLDASGEVKEVSKSRCFIDPVLLHL